MCKVQVKLSPNHSTCHYDAILQAATTMQGYITWGAADQTIALLGNGIVTAFFLRSSVGGYIKRYIIHIQKLVNFKHIVYMWYVDYSITLGNVWLIFTLLTQADAANLRNS